MALPSAAYARNSSRPVPEFPADEPSIRVPAVVPWRNAQVGDDSYLQLNIALRGKFNVNAPR